MLKNYYLTTNEYITDLINPEDAYFTNQTAIHIQIRRKSTARQSNR